ncbi:hypothetical protein CANARDRAFT_29357 [[Candida] arabinofermentans NRRL YB-2248]|uniref:Phosphoadenosine phosphosulphate reductase domain-containing protein n=1 Tax=[Candida] arabinofermentans NRRL YB-2248 TaxID=983967 RepID=A0A1E4SXM7_9ASCO|nr:hypothetical protein CANARDRAFT_29357 [[Candida] arabinofermentans NRRL YB-2248]
MSSNEIEITEFHLEHLNKTLAKLTPQQVLEWSLITFPNVFQTTAFGLTGLCILDMLDKLDTPIEPIDLVFIDTLYHFPQTLELIEKVKAKYSKFKLHIYKPIDPVSKTEFANEIEFQKKYGDELWTKDELKYDYLVKVEPLKRAHVELNIKAVFTGRRRSQGGARSSLPIVEIDKSLNVIKISPLASWDFNDVYKYIKENNVPYNELLDLGYKSVGDWHSTQPIAEGEDERSGRWKGQAKTECGIHQTSKYSQFLEKEATI